jgi:ADP-ribose pyrophosphatase YjhB (NUDIX family)
LSAAPEPIPRPAARAVVLDAAQRVLLVRFVSHDGSRTWWATPGGGLEPGETYEQAVLREIAEETGLEGVALGPVVWTREDVWELDGRRYHQMERFFLIQVDAHDPPPGLEGLPGDVGLRECRWWTLDELERTRAELSPRALPRLLRSLLRDGPPAVPIDAGV